MCTAISFKTKDHYFGRNLDLEHRYYESVTVTPRNFPLSFQRVGVLKNHYAIIGMASVVNEYPLYYDATNEHGLSIAALNFPDNAVYTPAVSQKLNLASFEIIPYLLSRYKTVAQVKAILQNTHITDTAFCNDMPPSPLHWLVADADSAITIEQTANGLTVYDNPIKVLANNPPFPYHISNLQNYLNLTAEVPANRFAKSIDLRTYSRGMGAIGLPGDLSSASRFVRAAFVLHNSVCEETESESVSQFFHILSAVAQQQGCVRLENGLERTVYSSCCNTDRGIYYYTTYFNNQITAVDLHKHKLDSDKIISYPIRTQQQIFWESQ